MCVVSQVVRWFQTVQEIVVVVCGDPFNTVPGLTEGQPWQSDESMIPFDPGASPNGSSLETGPLNSTAMTAGGDGRPVWADTATHCRAEIHRGVVFDLSSNSFHEQSQRTNADNW